MRAKYGKPRYAVWENVRGALSSSRRRGLPPESLKELCRIKDDAADVPRPPKGKWQSAGTYLGERILPAAMEGSSMLSTGESPKDASASTLSQILTGTAPEKVLFESEGVSGHSEKMQAARKDFARTAQNGAGETGWGKEVLNDQGGSPACNQGGMLVLFDNHAQDSHIPGRMPLTCLKHPAGHGGNNAPACMLTGIDDQPGGDASAPADSLYAGVL